MPRLQVSDSQSSMTDGVREGPWFGLLEASWISLDLQCMILYDRVLSGPIGSCRVMLGHVIVMCRQVPSETRMATQARATLGNMSAGISNLKYSDLGSSGVSRFLTPMRSDICRHRPNERYNTSKIQYCPHASSRLQHCGYPRVSSRTFTWE